MAPTREQMKEWQRQAAPGEGLKGWFDRGAWAAAGQTDPSVFSWPRALLFVVLTLAGLAALVALDVADATALVGGGIGVTVLVLRAHQLHRRFLDRSGRSPG